MNYISKYGVFHQYFNARRERLVVKVAGHPLFAEANSASVDRTRRTLQVVRARVVMAEHIGRMLLPSEVVHHLDHKTDNDAIENLKITTAEEHCVHHMKGTQVRWSAERRLAWSKRAIEEQFIERVPYYPKKVSS